MSTVCELCYCLSHGLSQMRNLKRGEKVNRKKQSGGECGVGRILLSPPVLFAAMCGFFFFLQLTFGALESGVPLDP